MTNNNIPGEDTHASSTGIDRRTLLKMTGAGVAAFGAMSIFEIGEARAQDMSHGASNFYTSDKVTLHKVTFKTQYQTSVAGNLYLPKDLDRTAKSPAIIVGHPMGAVKEQSANLYATKMAEEGFVAMSIDLPFWGESEGQSRNLVSPEVYAEAFSAGVDFLGLSDFVDRQNIGAIGVCGSGSFVISAAKIDPRIKAVATVSMYDMGAAFRDALNTSQTVEQRKQFIATAAQQRWAEADGANIQYIGGTTLELTAETDPIQREFYDFYRTPRGEFTPAGVARETTTKPTLSSSVKFMNFYPLTISRRSRRGRCCSSRATRLTQKNSARAPLTARPSQRNSFGSRGLVTWIFMTASISSPSTS